jgi:hypothetical protein
MLNSREGEMIMELQTQWEKDGELRGLKIGKIEGKIEEARKFISKFIQAQFGEDSKELLVKVAALDDLQLLEELADHLFKASRFEEVKQLIDIACENQQAKV